MAHPHSNDSALPESAAPMTSAWLVAVVLTIVIAVVYGRTLDVPFIFDDEPTIYHNPSIKSLWPPIGTVAEPGPLRPPSDLPTSGRPLVNLSLALNYYLGAYDPFGYHAVNVLLHVLCAMLLWLIVRRTLTLPYFDGNFAATAGFLALSVALLWSLHPLQTEAVIYITQRTELMMTLFYLTTLYSSLRYWSATPLPIREGQGKGSRTLWLVLAIIACFAGMASKEVMFAAPIIVLLYDRTFVSGSLAKALRNSWPLYVGLAMSWILLIGLNISAPRSSSAGFHLGIAPHAWWLTQCKIVLMYAKLVVWPSPLLLHYELPYINSLGNAAVYVMPVFLLGILALVLLWRNRPTGFLLTFIAAILAPTFIVPVQTEMAAERRMYLPLAAILVLLVVGVYRFVQSRVQRGVSNESGGPLSAILIATILFALIYGIASAKRLRDYYDPILLWEQVARAQPANYLAHYNLGLLYNHAGREPESFAELEAAVAAKPDYVNARSAFAFALMSAGRLTDAHETLKAALTIAPNHPPALNNMGIALTRLGRYSEAVDYLEHALREAPDYAAAHLNLGSALASSGQMASAVTEFQRANLLAPDDAETLIALARALAQTGRPEAAVEHYNKALSLKPPLVRESPNFASELRAAQRVDLAIAIARRSLELASKIDDHETAQKLEEWLARHQAQSPPKK